MRASFAVAFVLLCCLGQASAARSQQQKPEPEPAPKASEPTAKRPNNPEAQAVVDRALAAYRELKSYSDVTTGQKVVKGAKADGTPLKEDYEPYVVKFKWQRGPENAGFRVTMPQGSGFGGDGTTATAWRHSKNKGQRYVQVPYEARHTLPGRTKAIRISYGEHPLISILTGLNDGPLMQFTSLDSVRAVERDGVKGKEVTGTSRSLEDPDEIMPLMMFFADDTGLLVEAREDATALYNSNYDGARVFAEVSFSLKLTDVKLNERIPAEELGFRPEANAKRIERLDRLSDMDDAPPPSTGLIGKPAPAWTSKDFAGNPATSSDQTGKVVVMDFWATWCGPCIKALPHVEKLRQVYGPRGVVFLGINMERNQAGVEKAKAMVKEKGIGLKQIIDPGTIAPAFGAHAIPHLVIIDPRGVVRAIHSGFSDEVGKEIEKELDRLLAAPSPK
jgi:thiol-disulfide isomerase/thioredoxin